VSQVTGRTWSRRGLLALLPALAALLLGTVSASAHSYLVASDPPDGALLAKPPAQIVLLFSSAVSPDFTSADLVEAAGKRYQVSVVADPIHPISVVVKLPEIPNGSYRLSFSTRDRVDLHQTSGSIVFGVGVAPAPIPPTPAPAPARPIEVVLRWLGLTGFAALCGGLILAFFVVPGLPESTARRRTQAALVALALGGTCLQLASGAALGVLQAAGLGGNLGTTVLTMATTTEYGSRWLASTLLSVALALFLGALWRQTARRGMAGLAVEFRRLGPWALLTSQARVILLVIGQAAATAISGHAAGAAGLTLSEVLVRSVHLLAMGVWAGGVVSLLLAMVVVRRAGDRSSGTLRTLMVRFGPYGAVGFASLGLTGLLLAGAQVASLTALLSTPYGAVLIAKVAAVGMVGAIALRHVVPAWRALKPGRLGLGTSSAIPPTLALEASGAVVVVLLAAVLGSSAPARGPQFEPPAASSATLMTRQSGELVASVSIQPNRQGPNLVSVQVIDPRRPPLATIDGVTVLLTPPGAAGTETLTTTRTGSRFDAGTVRLATGDVAIGVVIRRAGLADTTIDLSWRVNPPPIRLAPVIISAEPLAPAVNLAAALIAAVAVLVMVLAVLRNRGRRAHPMQAEAPTKPARRDGQLPTVDFVEGRSRPTHNGAAVHNRRRRPQPGTAHPLYQGEIGAEEVIAIE
jgi:copper transport protein